MSDYTADLKALASEMWRELKSLGRDEIMLYDWYEKEAKRLGLEDAR